jgi:hypothetical protein
MKQILVIDTSILCIWLDVPGKDSCGPANDRWDKKRVKAKLDKERKNKTIFVLPLASIIETGNHIAQANRRRKECGEALAKLMRQSAEQESPWAAFSEQSELWSPENIKTLANSWPKLAAQKLSIGDATIKDVADLYNRMGCKVEIFTGDQGLKAYEPVATQAPAVPRRRQKR